MCYLNFSAKCNLCLTLSPSKCEPWAYVPRGLVTGRDFARISDLAGSCSVFTIFVWLRDKQGQWPWCNSDSVQMKTKCNEILFKIQPTKEGANSKNVLQRNKQLQLALQTMHNVLFQWKICVCMNCTDWSENFHQITESVALHQLSTSCKYLLRTEHIFSDTATSPKEDYQLGRSGKNMTRSWHLCCNELVSVLLPSPLPSPFFSDRVTA